jgi:putative ABC transport system permease protein
MEQYAKTSGKILTILQIILSAAALISLVVGGIGIMNMMIVSVTERTREIGVRKAMGATGGDILFQFLIEAVLVTLFGGAGGVVLALMGVTIVVMISGVPGLLYGPAVFLALGVSIATGLLAGIYPAWQASQLDPAVALRHE